MTVLTEQVPVWAVFALLCLKLGYDFVADVRASYREEERHQQRLRDLQQVMPNPCMHSEDRGDQSHE